MSDHIRWCGSGIDLLDQRQLPLEEKRLMLTTAEDTAAAIYNLAVRGAPAIGITAAYGMVLAARAGQPLDDAYRILHDARPTAVNLKWALDRMMRRARDARGEELVQALEDEAARIHAEDVDLCRAIGRHGAPLVPAGAAVLTHCNAGGLATGGYGTALGVIRAAWERHSQLRVWATETRPVWQGARLTAWELGRDGIPVTLLPDSAAGYLMSRGLVDLVVVGADRVSRRGHVANKIGTYQLAVLAHRHGVPFYVAIPYSTVDPDAEDLGPDLIEQRLAEEVTHVWGRPVAAPGVDAFNPAFDITPPELVTAFVTDRGIVRPPFDGGLGAIGQGGSEHA